MNTRVAFVLSSIAIAVAGCSNGSPSQGAFFPDRAAGGVPQAAAVSTQTATTFTLVVRNVPPALRSVLMVVTPHGKSGISTSLNVTPTKASACSASGGKITCTMVATAGGGANSIEIRGYSRKTQGGKQLFDTQTVATAKLHATTKVGVPNAYIIKYVSLNGAALGSMTQGPTGDTHVWTLTRPSVGQDFAAISEQGTIAYHPQPAPTAGSLNSYTSIAAGPALRLWFTDGGFEVPESVGWVTTGGTSHLVPATTPSGCGQNVPVSIANGPDNNAWFTEFACPAGAVGKTGGGPIVDYDLPTDKSGNQIFTLGTGQHQIVGGNGGVYFYANTCQVVSGNCAGEPGSIPTIGKVNGGGGVTYRQFDLSKIGNSNSEGYVTRAGDGNIWVMIGSAPPGTRYWQNTLVRITPSLALTYYHAGFNFINDLGTGPDGNVYFTDQGGVGRFVVKGPQFGQFDYYSRQSGTLSNSVASSADGYLWISGGAFSGNGDVEKIALP